MSAVVERRGRRIPRGQRPSTPHRTAATVRISRIVAHPTTVLVAATTAGATVLYWLVHRALIDDAYITLSYARTLADHGQWGMLPDHQANSATSPLNVLLLGGVSAVVGDPVLATGVVYVLTCVALVLGLRSIGRTLGLGYRVAAVGGPLLMANPLLASTIGLETMLVVSAMTWLVWACARGDAVRAGLVAGSLLWLRLDTVVIAAALVLAAPAVRRRLPLAVGLATAVVLPWLTFSWIALGSAIPDTLLIKQGGWGDFAVGLVRRYYEPYRWTTVDVLALAGAGLLSGLSWALWRRHTRVTPPVLPALVVAGGAYFGLLWLLDVPPFFWYYAPTLAALALAAAIGLAALGGPEFGRGTRSTAAAIGIGLLVLTLIPWAEGATTQAPLRAMPIHGNWALPGQYREIGREVGRIVGDTPVQSPGEVGALAYFCDCAIVDRFSDRAALRGQIVDARRSHWLYRLNYDNLDLRDLTRIRPGYWLVWRPGPDPTNRGWDATGIVGGYREHGHFELLNVPPRVADQALGIRHHSHRGTGSLR